MNWKFDFSPETRDMLGDWLVVKSAVAVDACQRKTFEIPFQRERKCAC
jgi:hypothetical protein